MTEKKKTEELSHTSVTASGVVVHCSHNELRDITEMVPNPRNPNTHPDKQVALLAKIIRNQGWRQPITVSKRSGFIVKGHGRLQAAKLMNVELVPVDLQDYANEAEEYADLIADNRIAELAEIDNDILGGLLEDALFDDFDMDLTGFLDDDLKDLLGDDITEGLTDEDEVPELPEEPTSKLGQIWTLGNHRLMCGDSTSREQVEKLMDGKKADMVFTDPPYNVAFNGRSGKHDVIMNDKLTDDEFSCFISDIIDVIKHIDPTVYYIWCNWKFYGILQGRLEYKSCIVWAKNCFGMGNGYRHQHEFCLFNGKIDQEIKNESDLWSEKKDTNYVHPTQKPVSLSVRAFGNHIKLLNVLDLFGGSGSTLIGAEQTGRNALVMELDPKYCDVIIKRWEDFAGKKAVLCDG